jgi:hypothetical protein
MQGEQVWVYGICELQFAALLFVQGDLNNDSPETEGQTEKIHVKLSLCHETETKRATNFISVKIRLQLLPFCKF